MTLKQGRKKRVIWDDSESAAAVAEAVRISLEDEDFIWAFVAKGQKVLSPERQRNITGRQGINRTVLEEFRRVRREILETGVPFEVTIEKEVLVERPRKDVLASITTEELVMLVAKKLAPIIDFLPALIEKAGERLVVASKAESSGGVPQVLETPTNRNPRVLLYGFLPQQEKDILDRTKEFNLELRFQKKEGRQPEPPPSCQWCVVINKVSHPAWNKLKGHFGKRISLVEGLTQALQTLADINSLAGSGVR